MSTPRKSFRQRLGIHSLTVYPYTHPRTKKAKWRFAYRPSPDGAWKYITRTKKEDARIEAERVLNGMAAMDLDWKNLSRERRRFLEEVYRLTQQETPAGKEAILEGIAAICGRRTSFNF